MPSERATADTVPFTRVVAVRDIVVDANVGARAPERGRVREARVHLGIY
jgi:hypothetical protein